MEPRNRSARGNVSHPLGYRCGANEEHFAVKQIKEQNVRSGQQETKEPWKRPEKSDHHPTKDSPSPRPRRQEDNETS